MIHYTWLPLNISDRWDPWVKNKLVSSIPIGLVWDDSISCMLPMTWRIRPVECPPDNLGWWIVFRVILLRVTIDNILGLIHVVSNQRWPSRHIMGLPPTLWPSLVVNIIFTKLCSPGPDISYRICWHWYIRPSSILVDYLGHLPAYECLTYFRNCRYVCLAI